MNKNLEKHIHEWRIVSPNKDICLCGLLRKKIWTMGRIYFINEYILPEVCGRLSLEINKLKKTCLKF